MRQKILVIGNGMAGLRLLEELAELKHDFDITVLGAEPSPAYNRIQLSHVLAGESEESLLLKPMEWYGEQGFELICGQEAKVIDRAAKQVLCASGREFKYDMLVLATGSGPFMLPLPGADKKGVIAFRDLNDCRAMQAAATQGGQAVVIGGGLLGIEAAKGLLNLGMPVTLVHLMPWLMERQLDEAAGAMLKADLEAQGMTIEINADSVEIMGAEGVQGLRLKDGRVLTCQLLVMAVGIKPRAGLAQAAGLDCGRAIKVNDQLQSSDPSIYAVGECAEHRGQAYGLVAPLYEQAKVLARHLAGENAAYAGSVVHTQLKVAGLEVFSAGDFQVKPGDEVLLSRDDFGGRYAKAVLRDGRLAGAILYGDSRAAGSLLALMKEPGCDKTRLKPLFAAAPSATGGEALVLSLPDTHIVCNCNGVSKGAITLAINDKNCESVSAVTRCTKAGGSCGACKVDVAAILSAARGGAAPVHEKATICACTGLSRDELVAEIRARSLRHGAEVRETLGFAPVEGCSKCRPAINYYLNMLYPGEHGDEVAARFVNERFHANIQKDGTFSVIPRIRGGVTTPAELMRIAKVAEDFAIPTVKITGGQRIDLLGVKKQDLPAVWAALDMPSGYAYAKALRTVKTCVGSEWCRYGVGDSTTLGIDLEKKFEMLNTPAKVKMAVSGCPRNCAECGIKDVGVVAVDGGQWDVLVGGNGGVEVKVARLLRRCDTPEEVIHLTAAFLQHYREDAMWNERTAPWVERKGLDAIKAIVLDPEKQAGLVARMNKTLATYQDPWKAAQKDKTLWDDPSVARVKEAV